MNQIQYTLSGKDEGAKKWIVQQSCWTCTAGVGPWHAEAAHSTNSRPCTIMMILSMME